MVAFQWLVVIVVALEISDGSPQYPLSYMINVLDWHWMYSSWYQFMSHIFFLAVGFLTIG